MFIGVFISSSISGQCVLKFCTSPRDMYNYSSVEAKCSVVSIKDDSYLLQIVKSDCGTHVTNYARK
jgi:hypothetical protein